MLYIRMGVNYQNFVPRNRLYQVYQNIQKSSCGFQKRKCCFQNFPNIPSFLQKKNNKIDFFLKFQKFPKKVLLYYVQNFMNFLELSKYLLEIILFLFEKTKIYQKYVKRNRNFIQPQVEGKKYNYYFVAVRDKAPLLLLKKMFRTS